MAARRRWSNPHRDILQEFEVSEDIFEQVQAIEAEAARIVEEAHRQSAQVRREALERVRQLSHEREKEFARRSDPMRTEASAKLAAELETLGKSFVNEKARLEKTAREQRGTLADRVVEQFGKAGR